MISFLQIYNQRLAALCKIISHLSGLSICTLTFGLLKAIGVRSGKSHKVLGAGLPKTVNKALANNQNRPLLEDARIVKRVSAN